jgi:hypothetical protein
VNVFLIVPDSEQVLEIRWLEPLYHPPYTSPAAESLARHLEVLRGVESVRVGRYSATLVVARHITTVRWVGHTVRWEVFNDPDVIHNLNATFPGGWRVELATERE